MGVWSATLLQPDDLSAGEGGFKRKYWEERVDAGQVETTDTLSFVSPGGYFILSLSAGPYT